MHPGNIQVSLDAGDLRPLHLARLRHHRHADRVRQGLPGAELHRLLPARLQARGRAAHRVAAGCRRARASTSSKARCAPCCEPYFDRPLKEISLGKVLLRLFQTSRRFNVEIQPQLVLLQKTLLNIEGLGRQLDPELDLWSTAKPFLERWMDEQVGWRGLLEQLARRGAALRASCCPQLPRLLHRLPGARPAGPPPRTAASCWPSRSGPTACCRRSSTVAWDLCWGWSRCRCCVRVRSVLSSPTARIIPLHDWGDLR